MDAYIYLTFSFSVCSHSHESAAAQQVGGEEEAGHQSSEGHGSAAHTETPHQLPLLSVSVAWSRSWLERSDKRLKTHRAAAQSWHKHRKSVSTSDTMMIVDTQFSHKHKVLTFQISTVASRHASTDYTVGLLTPLLELPKWNSSCLHSNKVSR